MQVYCILGERAESLPFQFLNVSEWVISCLLLSIPGAYHKCNAKSALDAREFVTSSLEELVQNRCIRKVDARPHVCSPLSVITNSQGKKRLVLNLRYLNQFLLKEKFKYEDLRV